jgi:hypothetical protein
MWWIAYIFGWRWRMFLSQPKSKRKRRRCLRNWSTGIKLKRLRLQKKRWATKDRTTKRKERRAQKKAEKTQRRAERLRKVEEAKAKAQALREEKRERREELLSLMDEQEQAVWVRDWLATHTIHTKAVDAFNRGWKEGYDAGRLVEKGTMNNGTAQ